MQVDQLSLKLQALADPTRRAMLAKLRGGEATVNELAQPFAMSLPAISKHIKVLEKAGLITRSRSAQQRPCQLSPDGLKDVDEWLGAYRDMWLDRLDRLETYLAKLTKEEQS